MARQEQEALVDCSMLTLGDNHRLCVSKAKRKDILYYSTVKMTNEREADVINLP